jgi:hypothetical protein
MEIIEQSQMYFSSKKYFLLVNKGNILTYIIQ